MDDEGCSGCTCCVIAVRWWAAAWRNAVLKVDEPCGGSKQSLSCNRSAFRPTKLLGAGGLPNVGTKFIILCLLRSASVIIPKIVLDQSSETFYVLFTIAFDVLLEQQSGNAAINKTATSHKQAAKGSFLKARRSRLRGGYKCSRGWVGTLAEKQKMTSIPLVLYLPTRPRHLKSMGCKNFFTIFSHLGG